MINVRNMQLEVILFALIMHDVCIGMSFQGMVFPKYENGFHAPNQSAACQGWSPNGLEVSTTTHQLCLIDQSQG